MVPWTGLHRAGSVLSLPVQCERAGTENVRSSELVPPLDQLSSGIGSEEMPFQSGKAWPHPHLTQAAQRAGGVGNRELTLMCEESGQLALPLAGPVLEYSLSMGELALPVVCHVVVSRRGIPSPPFSPHNLW